MTEEEQVSWFFRLDSDFKFTLTAHIHTNNRRAFRFDKIKSRRKNLCEDEK